MAAALAFACRCFDVHADLVLTGSDEVGLGLEQTDSTPGWVVQLRQVRNTDELACREIETQAS